MNSYSNKDYPVLIVVRGLPGSGKTHIATALRKAIGEQSVIMLDPDATDYSSRAYLAHTKALTAEGVDPKLHPYRFLRAQAHEGIAAHKIILWNQPFTNLEIFHKMIAGLRTYATEHGTRLAVLVVEVDIDPEVARQRVAKRKQEGGHGPSENLFARYINDYATFAREGYDVITVHGEADATKSVAGIEQALRELPDPGAR